MNWQAFIIMELIVGVVVVIIWLFALRDVIESPPRESHISISWAIGSTLWLAWYPFLGLFQHGRDLELYYGMFIPLLFFSCTLGAGISWVIFCTARWIILGSEE